MARYSRSITCAAWCFLLKALHVHAVGVCYWEPSLLICVGTNDSEEGSLWAHFQIASAICIANNARDGSGCTEESGLAPAACKNQPMSDEPGSFFCLTHSAEVGTVSGVREALPPPECSDVSDEFCDMERTEYVTVMGCPDCAQAYNDAVPIYSDCMRATTKEECEDKNPADVGDGSEVAEQPFGAPLSAPMDDSATSPVNFGQLDAAGAQSPLPTESGSGSTDNELGGIELSGALGSIAEMADEASNTDPDGSTMTERLVQSEENSGSSAVGTHVVLNVVSSGVLAAGIMAMAFAG